MGNKHSENSCFNLMDNDSLQQFLQSINFIDSFYTDTNLNISSKCLLVINNLINYLCTTDGDDDIGRYKSCEVSSGLVINLNRKTVENIEKLKFNCCLIKYLSIFNSHNNASEEFVELNNFNQLISLHLENLPITFVQHLKLHRESLLKLSVHKCIRNLQSLIELCGGDHSFSGCWTNLLHLDVRFNELKTIDSSVCLLTSLTVLDVSKNKLESLDFISKIPSLVCLNASYNSIKSLPDIPTHNLQVLIIGYNNFDGLEGIKKFPMLSTLNIAFNMIITNDYLQQLKEMDHLKDLIVKGNPICFSNNYRFLLLDVLSAHINVNFAIDGNKLSKKESAYLRGMPLIQIPPAVDKDITINSGIVVINPGRIEPPSVNPDSGRTTGSYNRRVIHCPNIDEKGNVDENKPPIIVVQQCSPPKQNPKEKFIGSTLFSSNFDSSMQVTSSEWESSGLDFSKDAYYVGKPTSSIYISRVTEKPSYFGNVSIQILHDLLMAIDNDQATVDQINLSDLFAFYKFHKKREQLELYFMEDNWSTKDKQQLSRREIEFSKESELHDVMASLELYIGDLSVICTSEVWPLSNFMLKCQKCNGIFEPKSKNKKSFICVRCQLSKFTIESGGQILSPATVVLKAFRSMKSSETLCSTHTADTFEAGTSANSAVSGLIFETRENKQTNSESVLTRKPDEEFTTEPMGATYVNDDLFKKTVHDPESEIELVAQISEELLKSLEKSGPHLEESILTQLGKVIENGNWIVKEPMSDVNFFMDLPKKVDDRLKLYFLSKVMRNEEILLGVFIVQFWKYPTNVSTTTMLAISTERMLFYSWTDKQSASIEECFKLMVEFKIQTLVSLDYCLNYQWIEISFKNKPIFSILVGDIGATKTIGSLITEAASCISINLAIRLSKYISTLKNCHMILDIVNSVNMDATLETLETSESYLIKRFSVNAPLMPSTTEYEPKILLIESQNIFIFGFSFPTKDVQQPLYELKLGNSIFALKRKIFFNKSSALQCRLSFVEHSVRIDVDVEFFSEVSLCRAMIIINKFWKELFRMDIEFEKIDFNIPN